MKSLTEKARFILRILCQDCFVVVLLLSISVLIVSWFSFQKKEMDGKIDMIKRDVSALQKILPVATADRWSRGMMLVYNSQLREYLNKNGEFPNIDTITLTTPVSVQSPFIKASTSTMP